MSVVDVTWQRRRPIVCADQKPQLPAKPRYASKAAVHQEAIVLNRRDIDRRNTRFVEMRGALPKWRPPAAVSER
jgi:hypothetical protein